MGQEIATQLRWDGRIIEGTAVLEGDALLFRGGASLSVPFAEMMSVEASSGWLELKTQRGLLLLELGPKAESWKERIKNPKALIEKLGISAGKKVCVVGKLDADLRHDLDASGAEVTAASTRARAPRGKDFDVVFLAASTKKDLERLAALKEVIVDDGGIWIVYPKGKSGPDDLTERAVLTAGRTLTLTDNKVAKVNDELTAVRFAIPVAQRKKKKK